jgi:hypothetical protein
MAASRMYKLLSIFIIFGFLKSILAVNINIRVRKDLSLNIFDGLKADGLVSTYFSEDFYLLESRVCIQIHNIPSHYKQSTVVKRESKRGFTCLALPLRPFIIDLTVYMDVSPNPGPTELKETTKHGHRISHVKSGILPSASHPIKYARSTLFSLKQCAPYRLSIPFAIVLKDLNILKTRGCRAGVRTRLRFTNNQIPSINSFCKYRRSPFAYADY